MALIEVCQGANQRCLIATRVADSVAEGNDSLDDHELYRLHLEISSCIAPTLILSNETADPSKAVRNYDIILGTVKAVSKLRKFNSLVTSYYPSGFGKRSSFQ